MRRIEYSLRGELFAAVLTRPVAAATAAWLERTYRIRVLVTPA